MIAAGILSAYYFGLDRHLLAVTGEFTRWGGHLLQFAGVDISNWGYFKILGMQGTPHVVDGVMVRVQAARSPAAALWANNVKLRSPQRPIRVLQAIVGGIIAVFGARSASGRNLVAFFHRHSPQFSLHAWLAIATAIGLLAGAKVACCSLFHRRSSCKVSAAQPVARNPAQSDRAAWACWCLAPSWCGRRRSCSTRSSSASRPCSGSVSGLLIERGQVCFTSAFRDLWITGRTQMVKATISGMAAGTIGVYSYVQLGLEPKIFWAGPNAVTAVCCSGFGIVFAGGYETGGCTAPWKARCTLALGGQSHRRPTAMLVGCARARDCHQPDKVNLLVLRRRAARCRTHALLGALALVLWWRKRFFRSGQRAPDLKSQTA